MKFNLTTLLLCQTCSAIAIKPVYNMGSMDLVDPTDNQVSVSEEF